MKSASPPSFPFFFRQWLALFAIPFATSLSAQDAEEKDDLPNFEERAKPENSQKPGKSDAPFDPFAAGAIQKAADAAEKINDDANTSLAAPGKPSAAIDVPKLARELRDSIVTVTQLGRGGGVRGTGTGFVVDGEAGLIATNLHVIGEGRPATVELSDGSEHEVLGVHAWDRKLDLAVIRIDPTGLDLEALPLADSDRIEQGAPVAAFGNPRGLKFSVVQGVASALRDHMEDPSGTRVDFGFPMIQLAIPIEMGNSGGPIVDPKGKVLGVVTIKWLMTDNLGFAVPSNALKPLLESPNPVPMKRWMTIGALDPARWLPVMGANWSQRAGVIKVNGSGKGFGGRALCISQKEVPDAPYEVAVEVKLDDESGAAGLAFACKNQEGEVHYGFYPSGGQLRLTRFEGADVYSWTILEQLPSDAYRPGEWNHLRIRIEEELLTGFVNDEKVIEIRDGVLRGGKAGLCKFRQTEAEFRHFKIAKDLSPRILPKKKLTQLTRSIEKLANGNTVDDKMLDALSAEADTSRSLIDARAEELEQRAAELRQLTRQLHHRRVSARMKQVLSADEKEINLLEAGLLIAWLDNPELDVDAYLEEFDRLGEDAASSLKADAKDKDKAKDKTTATEFARVEKLRDFLFTENGFHGSRSQYYHHSNSYLNEVLDDREGLPITLAVVFLELAERAEVDGLRGLALPGHFMVAWRPEGKNDPDKKGATDKKDEIRFIDVFDGGRFLTRSEAEVMIREITGAGIRPEHLDPPSKKDIVLRMIRNLVGLEMDAGRPEVARPYIDLILSISPEEASERFSRALLRYQAGETDGAKKDLEWLLENRPPGVRIDRLQELYDRL